MLRDALAEFDTSPHKGRLIIAECRLSLGDGDVDGALRALRSVRRESPAFLAAKTAIADIYLTHLKDKARVRPRARGARARPPAAQAAAVWSPRRAAERGAPHARSPGPFAQVGYAACYEEVVKELPASEPEGASAAPAAACACCILSPARTPPRALTAAHPSRTPPPPQPARRRSGSWPTRTWRSATRSARWGPWSRR